LTRFAPAPALAQATGAVTGIVTDEFGAVLPGATIEPVRCHGPGA
jgi:hypothetical protein